MSNSIKTISYQINANSFNTGIKNMKKNLQLFETELKNSAKEVVNSGKSIESLTKQHSSIRQALSQTNKMMDAYSDKIQESTKKLDSQKSKLKELDSARESARKTLEDTIEQYGKQSEEAEKAKEALKKLDTQYKNTEKSIQQTTTTIQNSALEYSKLEGKQQDLEQQLKQTSNELDAQGDKFIKYSKKFSSIGESIEKAGYRLKDMGEYVQKAGAIIVTASVGLAKLSSGAEMGFAKVNTLAKDSGTSLQRFKDSVYELSDDSGQNIEDLSNSIYDAISAGVDYADSVKFMDDVNKVAVGGFGDINDAVSAMTSLMNIYGYTVDDVGAISDRLFLAQERGVLTVGQLSSVLGESASTAKAYNVDLDNLLSGYVALTKAGIDVSQANTKLSSMFEELGDTGSTVGQILMEKTGRSFTQLLEEGASLADVMQVLVEATGGSKDNFNALWSSSEAAGAGFIIADENGKVFQETLEGMENSAGKCDEAFNIVSDTSEYKFKKALNELRNSFVKAGESLLPLMDGLSEGVEALSDFIKWLNKMNPEIVTTIAKFGALSLAGGTLIKIFGSVLIPIGKTVKGFAELSDVMVKVAYCNVPVEKAFSTMGTEATKLVGDFVKLVKVFNPVTLGVGAVVTAIAGLGVAFYNNQKDIDESEQKLKDMGNTLDDFTGRVRSNGSIIEEIFGKELSWNISDDYKQRLEESKGKVEEWAEYIKGIQGEIQEVLNSTEKSDYQKNAEVDELLGTGDKYTGVVNAETKAGYMSYLGDKGLSKEAISSYVDAWEDAYLQDVQNYNNNQDKIQALYESDIQKYGKLTKETEEEITRLKDENAELQTNIESTKYEDLDAMANKRLVETRERQEEENNIRTEGISSQLQAEREAVKEKYNLMREDADNRVWASEQEKQTTLNHISEMQTAEMNRTTFNQQQNLLRAEYDKEYADKYGLVVEDMVTENGHWATVIKDSNGEIVSSYFSTNEQMEQWANDMGYKYDTIETANGEMVAVVMDANDNIIGSVDNLANKYNLNCESINGALSKYQGTTSEKMAQVQRDLDAGIIKAEEYGMTDQEFLKVAQACFESGGDVKKLIDLLYQLPTERNTQVNVNVDNALANLRYLQQVAEQTGTKIAGVNSPGGAIPMDGYATGGIVDENKIATVNEQGWELVDTANSTASAYSLGRVAEGELAYLSENTKVTNHLTSTQQMRAEVNEQVNRAMSSVIGSMKREIVEALKSNGNSGNTYYDVDINNPNFVNENDKRKTLDETVRLIKNSKI